MKNEKLHTSDEEKLVTDLFQDFELSSPSDDFKRNTMDKVMHEWSSQPISVSTKLNKQSRIWVGVAIALSLVLIYLFDVKDITNSSSIFKSIQLTETQNSFTNSFESLFNALSQIPSLVYVVLLGISGIVALDKMINKLSTKSF